jgi:hypothetical protein
MTTGRKVDDTMYAEISRLRREEGLKAPTIAKRLKLSKSVVQTYVARVDAEAAPNGQGPRPPKALEDVPLETIHLEGNTTARVAIDGHIVNEYAEAMAEGATFPPVVLFRDAEGYWIGDGHHRCRAAQQVGYATIQAEVQAGGWREAFLYACAANATHGLRRDALDKRHVVMLLLMDEEWSQWSDREIARRCAVSHPFVAKIRAARAARRAARDEQLTGNVTSERTYTTKHGTVATMDTSRIGAGQAHASANGEPADEADDNLPAFLTGDGWSQRERAHAYARYLGLPAALQPPVAALLGQPGICVPDVGTMLAHITAMDEAQRATLVRLQTSPDAHERSCAISFALNLPPPPHPSVMLLYDVRGELLALSRRVEHAAARYPDPPGAAEIKAWGARLAEAAHETEALIERLPKEVAIKEAITEAERALTDPARKEG